MKETKKTDCLKCKYFITCEFPKQQFHKITQRPCELFRKKEGVK